MKRIMVNMFITHPSHRYVSFELQGENNYLNRKRRYAGVVFTRFCDLWFSVFFLKMLVVLKNVSSKNVDL